MINDQHIRPIEVVIEEMRAFYDQDVLPDDVVFKRWIDRLSTSVGELRFNQFK